ITRDSRHKRRHTGGRRNSYKKKRKYETGRQPAMTKLGGKRIHLVRTRGGNTKHRALRLEDGNYSWGSEAITRKTRILDVVYNASNNELVRTKTLVKNAIVVIDATPFRSWYEEHYKVQIGQKGQEQPTPAEVSAADKETVEARRKVMELDTKLNEQFVTGRLYAAISSRPGQSGRADGYILEGKELEFYTRKLAQKKGRKA
ncbi:RpS8, partial [Symbiodinium sp. KB8]